MPPSLTDPVTSLLDTEAGHAVYDALVQSNIDPRSAPVDLIQQLLAEELQFRRTLTRWND